MSYVSPIHIIMQQLETQMKTKLEEAIFNATQNIDVYVDKAELLKALKFDRDQYDAGYSDGYTDRDKQIVRCRECKHYMTIRCTCDGCCISDDWFCADGETVEEAEERLFDALDTIDTIVSTWNESEIWEDEDETD